MLLNTNFKIDFQTRGEKQIWAKVYFLSLIDCFRSI